jgi:hypothetical protein
VLAPAAEAASLPYAFLLYSLALCLPAAGVLATPAGQRLWLGQARVPLSPLTHRCVSYIAAVIALPASYMEKKPVPPHTIVWEWLPAA